MNLSNSSKVGSSLMTGALLISLFYSVIAQADQGMTSPTHTKYKGRVVFSKQEIAFKNEDEANFSTEFNAISHIYGRVYLAKAVNSHLMSNGNRQTNGTYEIRAFIDGEPVKVKWGVFDHDKLSGSAGYEWTTFQFSPRPADASRGNERYMSEKFTKAVQGLAPGKHQVRFEFWGMQGQHRTAKPMAVGGFNLTLANGERLTSQQTFPKDVYAGSDLEALKTDIKKAMLGGVAKSMDEMLDVAVVTDWKNRTYSTPPWRKYRKLTAVILFKDNNNDNLCQYTSYNFTQNEVSPNEYGSLKFQSFCMGCDEAAIECPSNN